MNYCKIKKKNMKEQKEKPAKKIIKKQNKISKQQKKHK